LFCVAFTSNSVAIGKIRRDAHLSLGQLHRYFIQAMDLMYEHLRHGRALPPSQVVHTIPRGGTPGAAPQITLTNVPSIADAPPANALITFTNGQVNIPN
jgi:hydroxybutyrate-dimer hydrolase